MAIATGRTDRTKQWPKSLLDWHEEVSRTEIQSEEGDVIIFALDAYGMGTPSTGLTISIESCPDALSFGIGGQEMEKLAAWLMAAKYEELALRAEKGKHARKLEKERRSMRDLAKFTASERTRKSKKAAESSDDD
jgi:hypothetical protein